MTPALAEPLASAMATPTPRVRLLNFNFLISIIPFMLFRQGGMRGAFLSERLLPYVISGTFHFGRDDLLGPTGKRASVARQKSLALGSHHKDQEPNEHNTLINIDIYLN